MKYWLMKSEPNCYSIHDLEKKKVDCWDGVRNYQARNFMRDDMKVGDLAIFYHSNSKPPGAAGLMSICKESYPDHYAQDPDDEHFDVKSTKEKPIWFMVDVKYEETFTRYVPLPEIKQTKDLEDMLLIKKGMRLSVQPLSKKQFDKICAMGRSDGSA